MRNPGVPADHRRHSKTFHLADMSGWTWTLYLLEKPYTSYRTAARLQEERSDSRRLLRTNSRQVKILPIPTLIGMYIFMQFTPPPNVLVKFQ